MNEITKVDQELLLTHELPADQHPALVYLSSLSAGSRRAMRNALNKIAELVGIPETTGENGADMRFLRLDWSALRFQHTQAIRALLVERYSYNTVNQQLSALRGVLKAAWRLGLMDSEHYQRAVDVQSVGGERLLSGRRISAAEISALAEACMQDPSPLGARDAALIAVLYSAGLRRAELAALDLDDYERFPDTETGALRVKGKRNRERSVPINNGSFHALEDWLAVRGPALGPLFWPARKGGKFNNRRMTSQVVYHVLKQRAAEAKVSDFSPHDLRRTFVSDLLEAGADVLIVSALAGHASPVTTKRYDMRSEEEKKKAIALLRFPYRRRE